jgi:uncharacterized integral membrane protein (TIGR00697 family)
MFNELLFLMHIIAVAGITLGSLALGKEALTTTVCLFSILANLLITKQITLIGLHVVSTDVFIIGSILGLNLLQEYFGKPTALKAIGINLFATLTYLAMTMLHMAYQASPFDTANPHFTAILSPMPRIIITSIGVYVVAQLIDTQIFHILKQFFGGRYLVLRNTLSIAITQLFDTIVFSFIALYSIVHSITHIIIVSYSIKMIIIILNTPCIQLSRRIIKNRPHD